VVRAPTDPPSAVARIPEDRLARRQLRAPEGVVVGAPPAIASRSVGTLASDPAARPPKESHPRGEPRGRPAGRSVHGSWLRSLSSKLERPVSGQTVIVLIEKAEPRSEEQSTLPFPKAGRPTPKRRGARWFRASHPVGW
jgi:hypothetical protein